MSTFMIYGAYGYTGTLITEECTKRGLQPILSGRNETKLKALAGDFNLKHSVIDLESAASLEKGLEDVDVVIHCAGPFSSTSAPMIRACLNTNTHYIDITGEYKVFELISHMDDQAKAAGIMLLPGSGFDVVPSDCLAQHLHRKVPDATHLTLAFAGLGGGVSRGTAKTMIEGAGDGHVYRKNGKLVSKPLGRSSMEIDYGEQKILSVGISWGDVVTAYHSTGIPNIQVYTGTTKDQLTKMRMMGNLPWLMKLPFVKNILKSKVDKRKPGPSEKRRESSKTYLYGKISNGKEVIEARLETPNGYSLTADSAVTIAQKIMNGNFKKGFQTPSTAYGEGLVLELKGCRYL